MSGLVWFRHDYRVMNHSPLLQAREEHASVIAVIIDCHKQWEEHHYSKRRQKIRRQAIQALSYQLQQLNIPLIYLERETFRDVPLELLKICRKLNISHVYFNREYDHSERTRDDEVKDFLRDNGVKIAVKDDGIVVPPELMTAKGNTTIESFDEYKAIWKSYAQKIEMGTTPPPCPRMADCQNLELFTSTSEIVNMESKAHRFLHQHVRENLATHPVKNASNLSSHLSAYITQGILSPAQCFTLAANESSERSEKWINGLIKRCFFRYLIFSHAKLSHHRPFLTKGEELPWIHDKEMFQAWCNGKTGYPLIDAAMNELNQTGWISHSLREITAMFLCKNLLIDWRWGERYFMQTLIDGDIPTNNGGWQWCASIGALAAPYFRLIDPAQEAKKIDPDAQYIKKWLPELKLLPAKDIVQPNWAALAKVKGYPNAIVDPVKSRVKSLEFFSILK